LIVEPTPNHNSRTSAAILFNMPTEKQLAGATAITRWPPWTSQDYIDARNALLKEEWALSEHIERVAALRRSLPQGVVMKSYKFTEGPSDLSADEPSKEVTLEDLAADGRSVVTYHFMLDETEVEPCSMCSMIVDTFNGAGQQLAQNVNFVVIGKAPLPVLRAWARKRGWNHIRILSSFGSDFNADMNLERPEYAPDVKQVPGISVFKKDGEGAVRHTYTGLAHFDANTVRGVDGIGCVYGVLDLTPEGRGEYVPTNDLA
jgi:predicted dithiol-disulfide oxidoreductase (DUF899 family)